MRSAMHENLPGMFMQDSGITSSRACSGPPLIQQLGTLCCCHAGSCHQQPGKQDAPLRALRFPLRKERCMLMSLVAATWCTGTCRGILPSKMLRAILHAHPFP